ncbi:Polyadenylate-binding protein 1 [Orobanche hederae]
MCPEEYMESDFDSSQAAAAAESKAKELENMKKRLQEIEEEAGALRQMQVEVEKEMGGATQEDPSDDSTSQAEKEEIDSRSIYVGNVDYACTPEEVQQHFQSCGTVNRVTILTDKFGQPNGFAYVEFVEVEAVQNALLLGESELHGRQLKVSAKQSNVPGMKQYRGKHPNPCFGSRRDFMAPVCSPYGYGQKNVYKDPDDGRQRFLLELEFVQCLANPTYIHYLAQNRYFEDEAFIGYLKYLQYWQRPEYIKFIMYPHCLFFLELLQNPNFRSAMAHPANKRKMGDSNIVPK